MKKLLLFFSILFIGNSVFAQVVDIVQQTWHLRNLKINNNWHYVPYGEAIELNFGGNNPNYTASTNGIENTFTANANFNNDNLTLTSIQVSSSNCTDPNCNFEDLYFYELLSNQNLDDKTFTYFYMVFSNGSKTFRITDVSGNRAEFSDQPLEEIDPNLFQSWYLFSTAVDLGDTFAISDYDPPIRPTLIINPDLSFYGIGSCNTFNGNFDYTMIDGSTILIAKDFVATSDTCEYHTNFENAYFEHFESNYPLYFYIYQNEFGFEMYPGFTYSFQNTPILSITESQKNVFSVYPNPAQDKLFIKSSLNKFDSITISDINGRIVSQKISASNEVDISNLKSGMYFITIESSEGNVTKKLIKN